MAVKTYRKGSTDKLSENFRVNEFACHGTDCGCTTVLVDTDLVDYLQRIREHFGKPVTVSSGYRCAVHNKSVDGATSSKHMAGMAADIVIPGIAPTEVAKYAESIGVKGIGLYDTFTHVDTRASKSYWYSSAQIYRSTFGGAVAETATESSGYSRDEFIRDCQKAFGVAVDGTVGVLTLGAAPTISRHKNATHAAVKPVQRFLSALGYTEVGTADGIAGAKFASAVAHFQQEKGLAVDGIVGAQTWAALLRG